MTQPADVAPLAPHGIDPLDRPWRGISTVVVATPLRLPAVEEVRALVLDFIERHPRSPYACRYDGERWIPVPVAERRAHVERCVLPGPDLDGDEAALLTEAARVMADAPADLPWRVWIGGRTLCLDHLHVAGDGASLTAFQGALIHLDATTLDAFGARVTARQLLGAAPRHVWGRRRQLAELVVSRLKGLRAHGSATDATPVRPGTGPLGVEGQRATGVEVVRLGDAEMSAVMAWRAGQGGGVSVGAALLALTARALEAEGVAVLTGRANTLVDLRRYLPAPSGAVAVGNCASSVEIEATLTDPRSVAAALAATVDDSRPFFATAAGVLVGDLSRRLRGAAGAASPPPEAGGQVRLTFNSMSGLPGLADLPWRDAEPGRYIAFAYPHSRGELTVGAIRVAGGTEIFAVYPTAQVDGAAVGRALRALPMIAGGR